VARVRLSRDRFELGTIATARKVGDATYPMTTGGVLCPSGDVVTAGVYVISERVRALARPPGLGRLRDYLTWLVASGEPVYGIDVDDSVLLPELRREDLISYTKGCYIGQELVARVKYRGHVNRALAGLRLEGDTVPAPGTPVMAEGKEIGRLTSSARSLALGVPIALGYLRREHLEPGAPVAVGAGEPLIPARVTALPFV